MPSPSFSSDLRLQCLSLPAWLGICFLWAAAACIPATGSAQSLQLEHALSGKAKRLKPGSHLQLELDMPASQMMAESRRLLTGELMAPEKGMLQLLPERERKSYMLDNGLYKFDETAYQRFSLRTGMRVPLEDIRTLAYQPPLKGWLHRASRWVAGLGLLSTLVAAPLASINYTDGTFNGERYFRLSGYSLAASGLGIAVHLGTAPRKFAVQQPGSAPGKRQWRLKIIN